MNPLQKPAAPYGLRVIDSCFTCVMREEGLFCQLPNEALSDLNLIRQNTFYPQGAVLFTEGESPRGLFILCSGQAKLTAGSQQGRNITLRVVEAGEVLGLSSVIANKSFPVSAETLAPSQTSFIPRPQFLRFLRAHAEVGARVAEHLSRELHLAWEQARMLALAPSAEAKLAESLLSWAEQHGQPTPEGMCFRFNMTHEEIAQTIGASRETVSRILSDFKRRGLIRVKGGSFLLLQPERLRSLNAG